MSSFKQTQTYFDKIIKTAQEHIVIFCGDVDSSFWTEKNKGYLFKYSLIDRLSHFLQKTKSYPALEIVYRRSEHNKILLKKLQNEADTYLFPLTDSKFIKPLEGIAESFIVSDKKNSFILPNHEIDSGIYARNDPSRAAFILNIFYQLMYHESAIEHKFPIKTNLLNLNESPAVYENVNTLMSHNATPIQILRHKNQFINHILETQNQL